MGLLKTWQAYSNSLALRRLGSSSIIWADGKGNSWQLASLRLVNNNYVDIYILILLYHFLLSKYVKEFWFWIINSKNHSTLHLNQMSSMRIYNFCNYNFTVLPIFTIEEENKESQFSWYVES